jgi:hypothetical protein
LNAFRLWSIIKVTERKEGIVVVIERGPPPLTKALSGKTPIRGYFLFTENQITILVMND